MHPIHQLLPYRLAFLSHNSCIHLALLTALIPSTLFPMSPDLTNAVTREPSARISTNACIAAQSGPAALASELRKSKRNLKRSKPPTTCYTPPSNITLTYSPPAGNNGDLLSEDAPDLDLILTQSPLTSTPHLVSLSVPAEATRNGDPESLFAPIRTLESSPAPPDLSLPDLPYANSSSPPVSPTPRSAQDADRGPSSDTPRVHTMLVDGDAPSVLMAPTAPSTPVAPTVLNTPVTLLQDIEAPPRVEDDEPDTTPISGHLAGSMEYQTGLQAGNPLLNPIDKFMKGIFPLVHDAHPAAPFINIDKATIAAWDSFPTFKLIAIPFGFESRIHQKHGNIIRGILSAVVDITGSQRFGISAPGPEDRLIKSRSRTPYAFLIHGLSKDNYRSLIKQRIWCSNDITFRIATTKPTPPDLLFSITELSSLDTERVHNMVLTIWSRDASISAIQDIIIAFPRDNLTSIPDFKSFLATLKVNCLLIKERGGRLNPIYNVYANGRYFQNHSLWSQVRSYLAGLNYGSSLVGSGLVKVALFHCNICHGADHPRGLCPFPKVQGWKGPLGLPEGVHA